MSVFERAGRRWEHSPVYEGWRDRAECANWDRELFFPQRDGERNGNRRIRALNEVAKQVCVGCPVVSECLSYAIALDLRYGTWGGLTEQERAKLTGRKAE